MRAAFTLLLLISLVSPSRAQETDEFVGPFARWSDVKRDYGAVGDGKADDTAAIQKALDDLRFHEKSCVLYFPAGTYRLTATVKTVRKEHHEGMGITIVGEDPGKTVWKWDGPAGGTMLQYDAWYSSIRRLTFDGAGKAKVCLAYGDAFSTYNETADMVFRDAETGMQMATADGGQAENAVRRCKFLRCSNAGLLTDNFNSLDIWVWYCRFEDCGYGLLNGAGNFHAYQNVFLRSKVMDIGAHNLMVFSFVNNVSIGSKCFMDWQSQFTWGSPTSITGNRIIEPTGDFAIRLGNAGPYLVAYNAIKSRAGKTTPEVVLAWSDQALVGNTYTIANAVEEHGHVRRVDEKQVAPPQVDASEPALPAAPPLQRRRVFDLQPGSGSDALVKAIEEASKLKGQHPVIHLPMGTYHLDQTMTIPPDCDVQLIGDGAAETATVIQWTGKAGEPVFDLQPPARATLRDFSIQAGAGIGIRARGCDADGAKIYGNQVNLTGSSPNSKGDVGLLVDGVEHADVQMQNLQGGTWLGNWVKVVGGASPGPGQVAVLCGATGTSDGPYRVEKGGRLVVRSVYHEVSGDVPQALNLDDSGSLCIDATRFSYATSADRPLIALDHFRGDFALFTSILLPVGTEHTARVAIGGDGSDCRALCLGDMFWETKAGITADDVWKDTSHPPAAAAMLLCNMNFNLPKTAGIEKQHSGYGALAPRGSADDAFLRKMLEPLRAAGVWVPSETPAGVAALRLERVIVSVGAGGRGLELLGK